MKFFVNIEETVKTNQKEKRKHTHQTEKNSIA